MIELDVAEYCGDCPCFTPESESNKFYTSSGDIAWTKTTVYCENKEKCRLMYEHILNRLDPIEISISDNDMKKLKIHGRLVCEEADNMPIIYIHHGGGLEADD